MTNGRGGGGGGHLFLTPLKGGGGEKADLDLYTFRAEGGGRNSLGRSDLLGGQQFRKEKSCFGGGWLGGGTSWRVGKQEETLSKGKNVCSGVEKKRRRTVPEVADQRRGLGSLHLRKEGERETLHLEKKCRDLAEGAERAQRGTHQRSNSEREGGKGGGHSALKPLRVVTGIVRKRGEETALIWNERISPPRLDRRKDPI